MVRRERPVAVAIGLTALIGLAYANKFLWSPALDALRPPVLGQRRGWLLLIQLALVVTIAVVGFSDPRHAPVATALLAALVAFLSASQDIVVDAYRIEVLGEDDKRPGLRAGGLCLGLPDGAAGQRRGDAAAGRPSRLVRRLPLWRGADAGRHRRDPAGAGAGARRPGGGGLAGPAAGLGAGALPRFHAAAASGWRSCCSSRCSSWARRWPAS